MSEEVWYLGWAKIIVRVTVETENIVDTAIPCSWRGSGFAAFRTVTGMVFEYYP